MNVLVSWSIQFKKKKKEKKKGNDIFTIIDSGMSDGGASKNVLVMYHSTHKFLPFCF